MNVHRFLSSENTSEVLSMHVDCVCSLKRDKGWIVVMAACMKTVMRMRQKCVSEGFVLQLCPRA